MSPQILSYEKYTYKCDIWSLGVLFYQLLVGRPPWSMMYQDMLENIKKDKINFP